MIIQNAQIFIGKTMKFLLVLATLFIQAATLNCMEKNKPESYDVPRL